MIHAYDKTYLKNARSALGWMLDYAVHDLGYDLEAYFDLFIQSGVAKEFELGNCSFLAGRSGVELTYDVLFHMGRNVPTQPPRYTVNRSEEYWTGWALAYYQWFTALSFAEIISVIPIQEVRSLYIPYHEMDISHFVDYMNNQYQRAYPETELKRRRCHLGLSQRALSELSGVPLRTIQQYEQRQKNINKAQAEYVILLAKTLSCEPGDLMERVG